MVFNLIDTSIILKRAINLIGKGLSCQESRCRIVADIARIRITLMIY